MSTWRPVESPDPELPRAVALAWGVAANPQRGPKREMSIERIVDVAVELADARRPGRGLDVRGRERARVHADVALPVRHRQGRSRAAHAGAGHRRAAGIDPRDRGLARRARRLDPRARSQLYLEHPWMLDIPISSTPVTPNNLAWLEAALQVLEPVPVSTERQGIHRARPDRAGALGGARQPRLRRGSGRRRLDARRLEVAATGILEQLVTPEEFPFVHAALHAGRVLTRRRSGRQPVRLRAGAGARRRRELPRAARQGGAAPSPPIRSPPRWRATRRSRRPSRRAARSRRSCARRASASARWRATRASGCVEGASRRARPRLRRPCAGCRPTGSRSRRP